MKWLAALFWVCFGVALWSMLAGNPTAINGVIGAGIVAVAITILWRIEAD